MWLPSRISFGITPLSEIGYRFAFPTAQYDFTNAVVEILFAVETSNGPIFPEDPRSPAEMVTADACIHLLADARTALFYKSGRITRNKVAVYAAAAPDIIVQWFGHTSFARNDTPKDLYIDLLNHTIISVYLDEYVSDRARDQVLGAARRRSGHNDNCPCGSMISGQIAPSFGRSRTSKGILAIAAAIIISCVGQAKAQVQIDITNDQIRQAQGATISLRPCGS